MIYNLIYICYDPSEYQNSIMYNKNNVFYKILNCELPVNKIYENDVAMAFYDINPLYKAHALIISRGLYRNFEDFISSVSPEECNIFFKTTKHVADILKLNDSGYRIVSNIGKDSGQEVEHFHMHILGGEKLSSLG